MRCFWAKSWQLVPGCAARAVAPLVAWSSVVADGLRRGAARSPGLRSAPGTCDGTRVGSRALHLQRGCMHPRSLHGQPHPNLPTGARDGSSARNAVMGETQGRPRQGREARARAPATCGTGVPAPPERDGAAPLACLTVQEGAVDEGPDALRGRACWSCRPDQEPRRRHRGRAGAAAGSWSWVVPRRQGARPRQARPTGQAEALPLLGLFPTDVARAHRPLPPFVSARASRDDAVCLTRTRALVWTPALAPPCRALPSCSGRSGEHRVWRAGPPPTHPSRSARLRRRPPAGACAGRHRRSRRPIAGPAPSRRMAAALATGIPAR